MRNAGEGELADAKSLLDGDDEPVDRILNSEDIASLRAEENAERSGTSSKFLPAQPEGAKAARDKARQNDRNRDPDESKRPETYVVQEGDTLYRIALRFYGRISAWAAIRDANKAVISTDGRVRAGQTIRLP
jgi:nucleoid-associated protein YgaU